jgi:hypothetical protein
MISRDEPAEPPSSTAPAPSTDTALSTTTALSTEPSMPSGLWAALAVRPAEVDRIRRLLVCSTLVGFALVCFFSGSNALFLAEVGADQLPWVYLTNAPLMIAAGFGYAWWSRRASTATVLNGSVWLLVASVVGLWLWNVMSDGQAAAFALAVWFRFLFIFGFLGLWEIASAVFDVRQSKRLFPAVALGAMVAFMVGGAVIGGLTAIIATVHLIALSAVFFGLYAVAFARAVHGVDFTEADGSTPATPREIVSDRFSRNLAGMRSLSILLIFVTEFIFYEQVGETFGSDSSIARFLGVFLAVATLAMVVVTAAVAGRYISRFGVGVGLLTMPAGLAAVAVIMGLYGLVFGIDYGFFVLAVVANLINMVLTNAIETPVGAVMYQPMPIERRMPVRVAVDGWLGSFAVALAGLLLLAFEALNFATVLPFVWLLAAIGVAGIVVARRLYDDYRQALAEATTVAFSGTGNGRLHSSARSIGLLADLAESGAGAHGGSGGLLSDDPAAAFAVASLARDLDDDRLALALPDLVDQADPDVACLAIEALTASGDPTHATRLAGVALDWSRESDVRAAALAGLLALDSGRAADTAATIRDAGPGPNEMADETDGRLHTLAQAVGVCVDPGGPQAEQLIEWARSPDSAQRVVAAKVLAATDADKPLSGAVQGTLIDLVDDPDHRVRFAALAAARHRVDDELGSRLLLIGYHPQDRRRAIEALATGGSATVEQIHELLQNPAGTRVSTSFPGQEPSTLDDDAGELPEAYVVDLVDHVYAPNTRRPVLLHRFVEPNATSPLRRAGFDAARRADVNLPASLNRMLRDDVEFATGLVSAWRQRPATDPASDGWPLVDAVLADEFEACRQTIWAGLKLAADSERIGEIEELARGVDDDTRANAIEALDTLLPTATRLLVLPILEPSTIAEAAELAGRSDHDFDLPRLRDHPRTMKSTRRLLGHYLPAERETEQHDMSDTIDRVIALKRVDIFSTLPYEVLTELADVADRREAAIGDRIIVEGEFGDELFALTEGRVLVDRSDGVSTELAAGTVFGELAVLDPGPRSATVTALSSCELLVVARPMLLSLTDRRPEVMAEIARVLSIRLRST